MTLTTADITAAEILPRDLYELMRPHYLREMLARKRQRRIALGDDVSLLFENRATVVYEVHELVRAGGVWTAAAIEREVEDCRCLLPSRGLLTATVMVHGGERRRTVELCERLASAPGELLALQLGDRRVAAEPLGTADPGGPVHYLGFPVGDEAWSVLADPFATSLAVLRGPGVSAIAPLEESLRVELAADLREAIACAIAARHRNRSDRAALG
jgi:hypothetical protein